MSAKIMPIEHLRAQRAGRVQEQGKIKTGVKVAPSKPGGRPWPKAIDTFRFVSSDRPAIDQLAALYGIHATAKPHPDARAGEIFNNEDGKWDFVSATNELRILLPPDPLGGTPLYEAWSGKGAADRRCDAVTCTLRTPGKSDKDEPTVTEVPCLCIPAREKDPTADVPCRLTTRLSVVLPDVRFQGQWQFSSTSQNVGEEFMEMVDLVAAALSRGLTHAVLRLEWRVRPGRRFTIPVIGFDHSLAELQAGAGVLGLGAGGAAGAQRGELAAGHMLELEAGGEVLASDEQRAALHEQWSKMTDVSKASLQRFAKELAIDRDHLTSDDAMRMLTKGAELVSGQYEAGEEPFE